MAWLLVGVLIFCLAHLFPAVLPESRAKLEQKLGENPYRGVFSLVIVGALVVIVLGWRSAVPTALYNPPMSPGPAPSLLVLIGFVLFVASQVPGNFKRLLRHPQMIGTLCWGIAHLLTNGSSRSVILFGGLSAWALIEILMINRRDGPSRKPAAAPIKFDVIAIVIGLVAFAAVAYFHAAWFGVASMPTA